MHFESAQVPLRKPTEVSPEVGDILKEGDVDAINAFHSLPAEDFSDSTRDLLDGTVVRETTELSPEARKILAEQESRYAQLQTDILSAQHELEDAALASEKRLKLNQKLIQLEQRAKRIDTFLQEARKFAGPLQ